ncbi:MAG: phosphate ABC transporter permease family protein, partial [Sedimenticola sp.]|nr:phosphate ABC transporter permease family protein [Sedimenticola sp.]
MSNTLLIILLLGLMGVAYHLGVRRSQKLVGGPGGVRGLHSLPSYYGFFTALWCGLPALLVLLLWVSLQGGVIRDLVVSDLPEAVRALPEAQLGLVINDIQNLAQGNIVSGEVSPEMERASEHYKSLQQTS